MAPLLPLLFHHELNAGILEQRRGAGHRAGCRLAVPLPNSFLTFSGDQNMKATSWSYFTVEKVPDDEPWQLVDDEE